MNSRLVENSEDRANVGSQQCARSRGPRVRMGLSIVNAESLAAKLTESRDPEFRDKIMDQLWLRTVLIEQRRRTRLNERPAFDRRADRILAAIDPEMRGPFTRLPDPHHREA